MRSLLLFSTFLFIVQINAQNTNRHSDFWDNVQYGGGFGLGFSNNSFNASISPSALYNLNDQLATGLGLNVNYAKYNSDKFLAYGASLIALYHPVEFIQLSAELEQLRVNTDYGYLNSAIEENYWSPALFIGAGYRSRNVTFGLRYNLLHDENKSIYVNDIMPFVRIYF